MKKTLSINLNGRVFNIDEDAYELLENYLSNLKSYFRKEQDVAEIIRDFESRIEELFQEKIRLGYDVISIEQVEDVIKRMGKPEDFGNDGFETEEPATDTNKGKSPEGKPRKKFYRNIDDKMLGGVCSGIAAYFGCEPLPIRIVFFILIFLTKLFIIPVYLILWIFIPAAHTASQKLEMRGEAVTIENIGRIVGETTANANKNNGGCLNTSLRFGLGCIGFLICIPLIFALFIVFIKFIALPLGFSHSFISPTHMLGFNGNSFMGMHPVISLVALFFVLGIPLFFIAYALFSNNKKAKPVTKATKWIAFLIWVIALVALIITGDKFCKASFPGFMMNWHVTEHHADNPGNNSEF